MRWNLFGENTGQHQRKSISSIFQDITHKNSSPPEVKIRLRKSPLKCCVVQYSEDIKKAIEKAWLKDVSVPSPDISHFFSLKNMKLTIELPESLKKFLKTPQKC